MTRFQYAMRELSHRRGRSLAMLGSIWLAVMAGILFITLANSYSEAVRKPMAVVGADMIVQLGGEIPLDLKGLVFPHPNALLPRDTVERIGKLPGVLGVTRAVYLWDLQPNAYHSVIGVEGGDAGLSALNGLLTTGRALQESDRNGALADSDYAAKHGLMPGSQVTVGSRAMNIVGIVDAVRTAKVFRADIYLPLAAAQELAASAPQIQALYRFGLNDTNLLLVKVDRTKLEAAVQGAQSILGKKATISSELSFRQTLESALFLSERIGLILALVIGAFAAAFVLRATASAINERQRDMAVLQAIGWSWRDVRRQLLLENVLLAFIGSVIGVLVALLVTWGLQGIEVTMDLPWDLSATPHFIPEANIDRHQTVFVPLVPSWSILLITSSGGLIVGLLAALAALSLRNKHPWTLLRSELQ